MTTVTAKVLPVRSGSPTIVSYEIQEEDLALMREYYRQEVSEGEYHTLTLKKWKRRRSANQNSLWHAMLSEFARQSHMDMELIKEGIKLVAMEEHEYPGIQNPLTGRDIPKPSRMATVSEFSILFDVTIMEASEQGVDLRKFLTDLDTWRKKNAV